MITVVNTSYRAPETAAECTRSFHSRDFQIVSILKSVMDWPMNDGFLWLRLGPISRLFSPPENGSGSLQADFLFSFRSQTTGRLLKQERLEVDPWLHFPAVHMALLSQALVPFCILPLILTCYLVIDFKINRYKIVSSATSSKRSYAVWRKVFFNEERQQVKKVQAQAARPGKDSLNVCLLWRCYAVKHPDANSADE